MTARLARNNPLSTDRLESLVYRPLSGTWEDILQAIRARNFRCALVGPQGSGKTTMLERLKQELIQDGFSVERIKLRIGNTHVPGGFWTKNLTRQTIVLLDGAEQLNKLEWWLLKCKCRSAGGFIITAHSPGLLPAQVTLETTPKLLSDLLIELLGFKPPDSLVEQTWKQENGNIRSALLSLYDVAFDIAPGD